MRAKNKKFNICVIGGCGYVGLITGLGFAELGNKVVNVDINEEKTKMLNGGKSPIYEEGLEKILRENLKEKRITFTTDFAKGVKEAKIIFVAVGTPSKEDGQADLSQITKVAETLLEHIKNYVIIAIKSTAPVGTVEIVESILSRKKKSGKDFDIVANPEFLREGKGLYDFFNPDRIVIGTKSEKAKKIMKKLYQLIIERTYGQIDPKRKNLIPLLETDIHSAQMIKYASNAFLATRISFINEMSNICEKLGANIKEVAKGMGYDSRIGHGYLEAGIGFGGPCLIKDLKALIKISEDIGHSPNLLLEVINKNQHQINLIISKIKQLTGPLLYKKIITIFGLAFKAGTNDVRTSLALNVINLLEKERANIKAYDPKAISEAKKIKPNLAYYENPYRAVEHSDALLILTDWPEFKDLDFKKIKNKMHHSNIVDGKNLLELGMLKKMGFKYLGMGQ